ncbi:MAG: glycosyltransferase family 39 protein [Candidatus Levyibacteriota bacterium]
MLKLRRLQKYKTELIAAVALISSYLFLRLYNIMSLPLFTDEAIYVRWSQIARYDASWRFISLTDGKQPSFVWATMLVMKLTEDPLFAGRLVSVIAGLLTMVGLYFLGREFFKNRWVGIISAFLYLIFPMALVYDRMAIYDSLVGTFAVWSLYFTVLLVRHVRLDIALILGMVIGGGVLTKTSAFFSIYLLPFSLLLFDFKNKKWKEKLVKLIALMGVSVIFAYGYYSILRLSPFFNIVGEKNSIFVYPLHDWIKHPFTFLEGNLAGELDWFKKYLTLPLVFAIVGGFFIKAGKYREKLMLIIWFAAPFVALALFGRVLYPRFIFFMILPLLPLAAVFIYKLYGFIKNKILFAVVLLLIIGSALYADYMILTNIAKAPIPHSDLEQYINEWPAGGGVREIVSYLDKEAEYGKIYIASLGTFGSLPTYAVEIYLGENRNVEKGGIYPVPTEIPEDLLEKAESMPAYLFVSNQREFEAAIVNWPITKIVEYRKGVGTAYSRLYKINPK